LKDGNRLLQSNQGGPKMLRGNSFEMNKVWKIVEKAATSDANILILGENGTGKEMVAREIHRLSERKNEIFVKVDMGAIPETLFESELFGYMRGAFTDARENKPGRFEIASGGTLFLDEIGNLPITMQSKILSVVQNREIFRLGGNKSVPIDVRIISATNMNPEQMISERLFREDLYYRLNTVTLNMPPLRERIEDIALFANSFLDRYRLRYKKPFLKFSKKALQLLQRNTWPGNIRQLEHCIENAVILSESNVIGANDLHLTEKSDLKIQSANYYDNEKILINQTIQKSEGNLSLAAKELGIARTTLYRKIKKHEL
jgi:transcriptional regulator with PAS, ATPase and Fis domain